MTYSSATTWSIPSTGQSVRSAVPEIISSPLYISDVLTTESGCFITYAMVRTQYQLIISSRPQLLPEDTKPATTATCKSYATPVCTARRSRYLLPRTWQLQVQSINGADRRRHQSASMSVSYFLHSTIFEFNLITTYILRSVSSSG